MRNRILAALMSVGLILGLAMVPSQAATTGGTGGGTTTSPWITYPARPSIEYLTSGSYYCVSDPRDTTFTYYQTQFANRNEDAFWGNIVRKKPSSYACSYFKGIGLKTGESIYQPVTASAASDGTNPTTVVAVPPPASEYNIVDPATQPTEPTLMSGAMGNVCWTHPADPNLISQPFEADGTAYSENYLAGKIVRPFPNNALGCASYNGTPKQEWDMLYAGDPGDYIAPAAELSVPENSAVTQDAPWLETYMPKTTGGLVGCSGRYRIMSSNWMTDFVYWDLDPFSKLPKYPKIRMVANVLYYFCENGPMVDKVKPLAINFCNTHFSGKGWAYDGVKYNAYMADSNTVSNPPDFIVPDGDGPQQCAAQDVRSEIERWLRADQYPQWSLTAWIKKIGLPEEEVVFKYNGSSRKHFNPLGDTIISEWRNS